MQVLSRMWRNGTQVGRKTSAPRRHVLPEVHALEERALLSITVQLNYSLDSSNFFDTQAKRDVMQAAANAVADSLTDNLLAIQPSGGNSWTANFPNPTTGQPSSINNLNVPANTIIIYVGGRSLTGHSEAGEGSTGGFGAHGSQAWLNLVAARGQTDALNATPTDFGPWGGSISFDNSGGTNWFFGLSTSGLAANQTDFFTVAEHEIGHVLGIGTSPSWTTFVSGNNFVGPAAQAAHAGISVPLDPALQHWAEGTTSDGVEAVMDPSIPGGTRKSFTTLDFAGLDDIGWTVQPPSPSTFSFGEPSYAVSEDAGSLVITVNRTGASGPATVQFATSDGTGQSGVHYTAVAGTLDFAAGQTLQSFTIPIVSYPPASGNKTFSITLSNPSSGGSLVFASAVSVDIVARGRHPLGDYDGVGFTQVGVFRVSTATWTVVDNAFGHSTQFGANKLFDIPVPGDYDGIGRTEQAVFRPSNGQWIVLNPLNQSQRVFSFGGKNLLDIPVPGDYDGIGRTEPAVFRPSTGQWFIMNPLTGKQRVAFYGAGNLIDIPVPGDYDGIGRTELAVFRPSTARWAIYNPLTNTQRFINYGAGNLFDIPVPGDYDGVGKTELAVFRPSVGRWVILNPTDLSQRVVNFGATNYVDVPLQAPIAALKKLGKFKSSGIQTRSASAGAAMTATQQRSMTAAAVTEPVAGTAELPVTGSAPSHSASVVAIAPMPERKPPAQSGEKSVWLEALESLAGGS